MTTPFGTMPTEYPVNGFSPEWRTPTPGSAFTTDGVESAAAVPAQEAQARGPWLDETDAKAVFRMIDDDVDAQEPMQRNVHAWRLLNRAQRDGRRFGRLRVEKVNNVAQFRYVDYAQDPNGADVAPVLPNKVGDLLRKIVAQVMTDPPKPEAEPRSGETADVASAQFATRFLTADADAARSNDAQKLEDALHAALVDQTGYIYLYTDQNGGGWRPKQIVAAPEAPDPQQPMMVPAPPPTDAMGMPIPLPPDQPPALMPFDGDGIMRYVDEGVTTFVTSPSEAGRQWQAGFALRVIDASRVRLLPPTATCVTDSEGAILLMLEPFATLERWFPDIAALSNEDCQSIVNWEPKRAAELIPPDWLPLRVKAKQMSSAKGKEGRPRPDALCWYYAAYRKATPEYPEGAFVYCGGNGLVFAKGAMSGDVELPDGTTRRDLLDVPIADCTPTTNGAVIEWFARPEEYRARVFMGILESLDQNLHPHVYGLSTSVLQDFDYQNRDGAIKWIHQKDDVPVLEEPRQIPRLALEAVEYMDDEMNAAAGRPETAQGANSADVNSGAQVMAIVEQAKVTLGSIFRASLSCFQRLQRLKLQQARVKFDVPQRQRFVGEDGSATEAWFRGADLHGVEDVAIARGSGTMWSPAQKQQMTLALQQAGVLSDPLEVERALTSGVSGTIGLQDNPHRQRIARQIKAWLNGPPDGWMPAPPPPPMPPQVDPMTGMAMPPAPPPPPPPLPCFTPIPVDTEPAVAAWRARELGRLMAGVAYAAQPPDWQMGLQAEYMRMQQAMTPPPAPTNTPSPPKESGSAPEPGEPGVNPLRPPAPPSAPRVMGGGGAR